MTSTPPRPQNSYPPLGHVHPHLFGAFLARFRARPRLPNCLSTLTAREPPRTHGGVSLPLRLRPFGFTPNNAVILFCFFPSNVLRCSSAFRRIFSHFCRNALPEDVLPSTTSTSTMSVPSNQRTTLHDTPYPTGPSSRIRWTQSRYSSCIAHDGGWEVRWSNVRLKEKWEYKRT